jgi:Transposase IS116/IS110/IS902 family
MHTRRGSIQGYNAQAVTTTEQVIVAAELTQQANDLQQLDPMLAATAATLAAAGIPQRPERLLADCGYWTIANLTQLPDAPELLIPPARHGRQGKPAGAGRFRSKDAYARFTGTAPIPVWSGDRRGRVRLNRSGNRTVNTALHMIAVTQIRGVGPGQAYVERLMARGKTRTEAVRLLRRRLSDVVFTALRADEQARSTATPAQSSPATPKAKAHAA